MRRLKILIWHIHGSYLDAITSADHDWYLPVKEGHYGGRRWTSADYVREVPFNEVKNLDLDLVIFQSPKNYHEDRYDVLSPRQLELPAIYLEHNSPRPHPVDSRHTVAGDPGTLLVHVTHFNRLMWDNGVAPTAVVEHSVNIDPTVVYQGHRERGITLINGMQKRPRIVGLDLFLYARERVPLDVAGMETEAMGGLGDIKYIYLHRTVAEYRFLFSPIRYTSLPLAVIEGMTIGLPVIALATTELPTVIENGYNGFLSCEIDELIDRMRELLADPSMARRLGANARRTAQERFGLDRFVRDWEAAFEQAIELRRRMPAAERMEALA